MFARIGRLINLKPVYVIDRSPSPVPGLPVSPSGKSALGCNTCFPGTVDLFSNRRILG